MNLKDYQSYDFKIMQFWQINIITQYGNLSASFKTETEIQEMIKEIENKLNKKCKYRLQENNDDTNSFTNKKKKGGRPSNKKHWIIEFI